MDFRHIPGLNQEALCELALLKRLSLMKTVLL